MPARLNKTMVILIAAAVVLTITGGAGAYWFFIMRNDPDRRIALAEEYLAAGDYAMASEQYRVAFRRRSNDLELLYSYIDTTAKIQTDDRALANGYFQRIQSAVRQAAQLQPSDEKAFQKLMDLYFYLASDLGASSYWDEIFKESNDRLTNHPNMLLARKYRGIAQVHRFIRNLPMTPAEREMPSQDLALTLQMMPEDTEALYHLALWNVLFARYHERPEGDPQRVEPAMEQALQLTQQLGEKHGDDPQAVVHYIELMSMSEKPDEALAALDRLETLMRQQLEPVRLVVNTADLLIQLDTRVDENATGFAVRPGIQRALQLLEAALEKHPESLHIQFALGRWLSRLNEDERAMQLFEQMRQVKVNATPIEAMTAFHFADMGLIYYCNQKLSAVDKLDAEARKLALDEVKGLIAQLERNGSSSAWTTFLSAKLLLTRGEIAKGADAMEQAILQQVGDPTMRLEAYRLAAQSRMQLGHWGTAAKHYRTLIALQPQNRNLLLALAEIYIKSKQFTDAQNVLTQFLAEDQDHLGALMLLSSVHASLGQHTQAIDILQSLITRDDPTPPQRTALAMLLAQSLHAAARTDEARQLILAEFNKRPDDARLLQLLLALTEDEALQAQYLEAARQAGADANVVDQLAMSPEQRIAHLKEMLAKEEDEFTRRINMMNLYLQTGEFERAEQEFQAAAKLKPEDPAILQEQFERALRQQDWPRAEQLLVTARQVDADLSGGMYLAGRLEAARGEHSRAINNFQQALRTRPQNPDCWFHLASSQRETGDLTAAENSYKSALDLKPDHVEAIVGLARLQAYLNNEAEALHYMRRAIRVAPNNRVLMEHYLALEQQAGDKQLVLTKRQEILEAQPDNLENHAALALLYASNKQRDQALGMIDERIREEGATLANTNLKVRALLLLEEYPAAMETMTNYIGQRGADADTNDWIALADLRLRLGREDAALEALREARAVEDPQTRPATRLLADLHRRQGRIEEFVKLVEQMWNADRSDYRLAQSLAGALAEMNEVARAEQVLDAIPREHRQDIDTQLARATLATVRHEKEEALNIISQVIEREPNRPALYFHRARMRLQARDPKDITPAQFAEAERDLQKAVQLNPGFSEARRRLSDLYLQQGRIDRALAELYALIERDTRSSFNDRVRLANILMQNQQWPELTNVLQNGAQAFPTSSQWPFMQGQAAQMRQQFEIARQKYTEALGMEANGRNLQALVGLHLNARRAAEALALLEEHAALVGENPILHAMRGRAMVYDKREAEGHREFDFAMTHSPNTATLEMVIGHIAAASNLRDAIDMVSAKFPIAQADASKAWIHLHLVNLEMRLYDYQAAEARLRQVEKLLAPEDPRRLQLDHQLAVIHHFLGRTSEAVSGYRKVLEREENNPQILNNLAYLLCEELNQPKEALEYAERAARLLPNDASVLDTLGWVQFKAGLDGQAIQTLERAISIAPLADALLHLGEIYLKAGRLDEARQMLERARQQADRQGRDDLSTKARELLQKLESP